jgi:hypothetical protein
MWKKILRVLKLFIFQDNWIPPTNTDWFGLLSWALNCLQYCVAWFLNSVVIWTGRISEILCNVNFSYCSSATTAMPDGCGGWVWINFVGCTVLPEPWIVWPGTLEQNHLFGHPIQAWTMPELCLRLFSSLEEYFWYLSVQLNPIFKPLYKSNAWKYFLVIGNRVPTYKCHHSQWGYRLSSMSLAENWEPRTYRTFYPQM